LLNRRNDDRFGEKVGSWVPFITKIESADMGKAMVEHAVVICKMSEEEREKNKLHELSNA
jgi:hypothetical protein